MVKMSVLNPATSPASAPKKPYPGMRSQGTQPGPNVSPSPRSRRDPRYHPVVEVGSDALLNRPRGQHHAQVARLGPVGVVYDPQLHAGRGQGEEERERRGRARCLRTRDEEGGDRAQPGQSQARPGENPVVDASIRKVAEKAPVVPRESLPGREEAHLLDPQSRSAARRGAGSRASTTRTRSPLLSPVEVQHTPTRGPSPASRASIGLPARGTRPQDGRARRRSRRRPAGGPAGGRPPSERSKSTTRRLAPEPPPLEPQPSRADLEGAPPRTRPWARLRIGPA